MISHAHRVIFIHIPKTAGTSVEAALGHHGTTAVVRGAQDHRSLRQLQWPHGGIHQLSSSRGNRNEFARAIKSRLRRHEYAANRLNVSRAQYESYFKFAVVRNPWARMYSWYRNVLADALHRERLDVQVDTSFATFVARYAGTDLLRPQTYWLVDFSGRIGVDFVCRFENLQRDYAEVCRLAHLPELPLPHLNGSGGGGYLEAYENSSRGLIAERYRQEIERFGYTFGR